MTGRDLVVSAVGVIAVGGVLVLGARLAHVPDSVPPERRLGVLEGHVRRHGVPVAARVEVLEEGNFGARETQASSNAERWLESRPPAPQALGVVASGDDGRFRFPGIGTRPVRVVATAADGAWGQVVANPAVSGARVAVDVEVLERVSTLRGRVRFLDGTPWGGTVGIGAVYNAATEEQVVAVDEEGRFVLDRAPDAVVIVVARQGDDLLAVFHARPSQAERELVVPVALQPFAGRVVADEDGRPVAGAVLIADAPEEGGWVVVRTATGVDGRFAAPLWPRKGSLHVRAPGRVRMRLLESAPEREIRLPREAVLSGHVLREDGTPVVGATVIVAPEVSGSGSADLDGGRTDGAGRFRIDGLPALLAQVRVEAPGLRRATVPRDPTSTEDHLLAPLRAGESVHLDVRLRPGQPVRGRVLDADGVPVPGAVVEAAPDSRRFAPYDASRWVERGASTDGEGRFEIGHLAPSVPYRFIARAPDRIDSPWSEPVVGRAESPPQVVLRFPPSRRVVLRVEDAESHRALEGIVVSARGLVDASAQTDASGNAVLRALPTGPVTLQVAYAEGWVVPVEVGLAPDATEATLRLSRGLAISGRAVDATGNPLPSGQVTAAPLGRSDGRSGARIGADGLFSIRGLREGRYRIELVEHRTGETLEGTAEAEAGSRDVEVRVAPRRPVGVPSARVLDPEGHPVPFARARARGSSGRLIVTSVFRGTALIPEAGEKEDRVVEVWGATRDDGTPLPLGVGRALLAAGALEIEVRLPPESRATGRVVRDDGGSVEGLRLHASFAEDDAAARAPHRTDLRIATTVTDAKGAFRLGGLAPEGLVLWVEAPAECADSVAVPFHGTASAPTLALRRAVDVEVRVADARGVPFPGAHVTLRRAGEPEGGPGWPVAADGDGRVVLRHLDPRATNLSLRVWTKDRDESIEEVFDPWTPAETRLVLPRILDVEGRVVHADGTPASGASVRARPARPWRPLSSRTDASGRFRLGVPEGDVELEASASGDDSVGSGDPVVVAAGARDVAVSLPAIGELLVQVRGCPAGARAEVARLSSEGRRLASEAVSNDRGEFLFRGVPLHADVVFFLRPVPGKGVPAAWIDELRAGMEVATEPRRSGTITGRADFGDRGGRLTRVVARRGPVTVEASIVGDGDFFRVEGLPDVAWTIEATANDPAGRTTTATSEARPDEPAELSFR